QKSYFDSPKTIHLSAATNEFVLVFVYVLRFFKCSGASARYAALRLRDILDCFVACGFSQ
ncbi:MAG: hypothetical protein LBV38_07870, partial [Alistipes sp.]|nr:hypothetical protein [Alistipes sp.]